MYIFTYIYVYVIIIIIIIIIIIMFLVILMLLFVCDVCVCVCVCVCVLLLVIVFRLVVCHCLGQQCISCFCTTPYLSFSACTLVNFCVVVLDVCLYEVFGSSFVFTMLLILSLCLLSC